MDHDLKTIADTWLRQDDTGSDEDFWAWEETREIISSGDLGRAWSITLLLMKTAKTDNALGSVAAGPLEDFVDVYGDAGLDLLEPVCDQDVRLQFALSGIWLEPDSPVLQRWQSLMIKYGFASGNRKPLSRHPDCWPESWPVFTGQE